jgi:large subunit ribosomal protein L30
MGMIDTVKDYITYGELSKESVASLLMEKGRLAGNKKLTNEYAKEAGYKSLEDLAAEIASGKAEYWKLPRIQPVFRLHPPTKGYKGKIKRGYGAGGELGYRGESIKELLDRML